MEHATSRLPLREIVSIVSDQLIAMGRQGKAIEDVVGEIISNGQVVGNSLGSSLQGLDHMVQIIDELAIFLRSVTFQIENDIEIDITEAARRLKLRELYLALGGQASIADEIAAPHIAGDVDFF